MRRGLTVLSLAGAAALLACSEGAFDPLVNIYDPESLSYIETVWIPPGTFEMGSTNDAWPESWRAEPVHTVRITRGFHMAKYETTCEQWSNGMYPVEADEDYSFDGPRRPMRCVSWNRVEEYCQRLTERCGGAVRLPTEAEWEYACRAGTTTLYHFGDTITSADACCSWSYGGTLEVGSFASNVFGLYDMHGNAREWVEDWWDGSYYAASPTNDPPGPVSGTRKMIRGGHWNTSAAECTSAARHLGQTGGGACAGFRVIVEPPPPSSAILRASLRGCLAAVVSRGRRGILY